MIMTQYYFPAEWQPQEAVQFTWPHAGTDWAPYLSEIESVMTELARAIAADEHLIIAAQEPEHVRELLDKHLPADAFARVNIYKVENNDTWARDHAFISLLPCGGVGERRLLNFRFNGWGCKFPASLDNALNLALFEQGAVSGEVEDHEDFILEGGSIESDGRGTVLTTSQCLLAPHRNQPLSRADIEAVLKRVLCAERVLWLDHGNLIGDDTDGHIDTLARFAPDDTILYVACDDPEDSQYADLKAMEAQLRELRTLECRPYHLVPLPLPHAVYYDGERLPVTYANFLVTNRSVIVPVYGDADHDAEALSLIAAAFPDRKPVAIRAEVVARQHGSLHCLTMQYPFCK